MKHEKYLNCIHEFRRAIGQNVPPVPKSPIPPETKAFYSAMFNEEFDEVLVARLAKNREEELDGYVDLAYFAVNCMVELGFGDWVGEGLKIFNPEIGILQRFIDRLQTNNGFAPALINHLFNYSKALGEELGDFEGAFMAVHAANMDKLDISASHANKTLKTYQKQGIEGYKVKVGSGVNARWCVKRVCDDKILKSHLWQAPNLKPFLTKVEGGGCG